MSLCLHVGATGFAAPGLDDAAALALHLDGAALAPADDWTATPRSLSRRQMQRLSLATRVAIMAAQQVARAVPADGAWVFASSVGEGATLDAILRALSDDEVMIQPLRFQNAVHNTAQGQWSILAQAAGAATSIAAYDGTAAAGLLKAAMQATLEDTALGLVVYDAPLPPPLYEKRPMTMPMAAALALSPVPVEGGIATLVLDVVGAPEPTDHRTAVSSQLESSGNPAAAILPLMKELFRRTGEPVTLPLAAGAALKIDVRGPSDAA